MNIKTKRVTYYADFYPGWQDCQFAPNLLSSPCSAPLTPGCRRIRIVVDLPCFGGSADAYETHLAIAEEASLAAAMGQNNGGTT